MAVSSWLTVAKNEEVTNTTQEEIQEVDNSEETENTKVEEEAKTKETEANKTAKKTEATETENASATKTSAENLAIQVEKNKLENKTTTASKETATTDPVKELTTQIAAINELKSGQNNAGNVQVKAETTLNSSDCCTTIKMNEQDTTFLLNLVQNQNMTAQGVSVNGSNTTFTNIKSEATQQTVQVSATFLDALNESVKTNKPFRIDFDNDIAVIMKVDKDGVLSANFIPGSSAVEAYLKNNISSLRQSFDEQGLDYNELSYSNQQKEKEKEEKKENKDE